MKRAYLTTIISICFLGKTRTIAQAAAKKSWENRDLPNWRDQVDDLLEGKQIFVRNLRQFNSIYVAAKRKRVQTFRFKVSDSKFAVVAEGVYDRKIEFIRAGNDGVQANPPAVHLLAPLAQAHLSLRANAFGSMAKELNNEYRRGGLDRVCRIGGTIGGGIAERTIWGLHL
jgi:hypothetical protein